MNTKITIDDIAIRTELKPGDLGYVIHRPGKLYGDEYDYGVSFEAYVASGIFEFYKVYNPERDRVWICEHNAGIIGFLLLMHRESNTAQLRYFYVEPEYRGIGLGKKLMSLYMDFLLRCGYASSYYGLPMNWFLRLLFMSDTASNCQKKKNQLHLVNPLRNNVMTW
jgi:peptidyl-dipeptidase Dcp